jgi:hypothetical protein
MPLPTGRQVCLLAENEFVRICYAMRYAITHGDEWAVRTGSWKCELFVALVNNKELPIRPYSCTDRKISLRFCELRHA